MLKSYDLYVLKVIKANALILGFQSMVKNLEEVSSGMYKEMILKSLDIAQIDICKTVN